MTLQPATITTMAADTNTIFAFNNNKNIPAVMHKEHDSFFLIRLYPYFGKQLKKTRVIFPSIHF